MRLTRRMFKRQMIGHVARGVGYRVGNSYRGLRFMARRYRWVDRDVRKTKDGVIVLCHWGQPLKEDKFTSPDPTIHRDTRIEDMTWAQVQALVSTDGFHIHRVEDDIAAMGRLRKQRWNRLLGAYWEPKAPHSLTLADWRHIKALCVQHHVKARGYTLIANQAQLPLMREAGIPAHRLNK